MVCVGALASRQRLETEKKEGFGTRGAAQKWEYTERQKHTGEIEDISIGQMAERYLEDLALRAKPTSLLNIKKRLAMVITGDQGLDKDKNINDVTVQYIKKVFDILYKKGYAKSTLIADKTAIGAVYRYARRYYDMQKNPVDKIQINYRYDTNKKIRYWTLEQFSEFIEKTRLRADYRMAIELLFWSGCRKGEILGLRVKDLEKNRINIIKNRVDIKNGVTYIQTPKNGKTRVVAMPTAIMKKLKKYIQSIPNAKDDDEIFSQIKGTSINPEFVYHQKIIGMSPQISIHGLRHSHISLLMNNGYSPEEIARRVGHADGTMIRQIYGHVYQAKLDQMALTLGKLYR